MPEWLMRERRKLCGSHSLDTIVSIWVFRRKYCSWRKCCWMDCEMPHDLEIRSFCLMCSRKCDRFAHLLWRYVRQCVWPIFVHSWNCNDKFVRVYSNVNCQLCTRSGCLRVIAILAHQFEWIAVIIDMVTFLVPSTGERSAAIFAREILLFFMMRIHVDVEQPFVTAHFFANEATGIGFGSKWKKS